MSLELVRNILNSVLLTAKFTQLISVGQVKMGDVHDF